MYLLASLLAERLRVLTFALAFTGRGLIVDFGGGGEDRVLSRAVSSAAGVASKILLGSARGRTRLGRVSVELPISCSIPLDFRAVVVELARVPEGDMFSTSDAVFTPLTDDHVLEETDLGVPFRVGTAAPRKPALRSCSLLVCREDPGPESGREGEASASSSSSHDFEGVAMAKHTAC